MAQYKIWFGEQYLGEAELSAAIDLEFDLPKLLELFEKHSKPAPEPARPRPLLYALVYHFSRN